MTPVDPLGAVPRAGPASRASDVRDGLAGRSYASAVDIAVCEGERLLGLVPIEQLLAAHADVQLAELIEPVATVGTDADEELAASELVRRGGRSVAVVDGRGRFRGLVPPERALAVLWREHGEDLARLGGLPRRHVAGAHRGRGAGAPETLAPAAVARARTSRRDGVGRNRRLVRGRARPTGAAGGLRPRGGLHGGRGRTQTEAVVIRGISVGVPVRHVVARELTSGVIIGVLIAAAFFPFAYLVWGNGHVAATVALALFASTATATGVAMGLPYALNRLGRDPAFGAGPLATVIQDLLSILIYFAVAVALGP